MAERRQEGGHNPQRFVEEVDFSEIEHIEVSLKHSQKIIGKN